MEKYICSYESSDFSGWALVENVPWLDENENWHDQICTIAVYDSLEDAVERNPNINIR